MTEPLSIPVHAVMGHPPEPGGRVLVYGAGIIGLLTTMVLRALAPSVEITVLARYPHQQEKALELGAKQILTGGEGFQAVASLTGGKWFTAPLNNGVVIGGFDMIYDCVANPRTINNSLRWVRAGGTVVMLGSHMAPMPKIDLTPVWYHQVDLVGTYGHGMDTWKGVTKHTFEWVFDHLRTGAFTIDGLITHRFPMAEYKQAIRVATSKGKERAIKVMFEHE
jgi:threonine dehydrogenase-like Zn-dependent dehydrogenase